jgi:hypothetical protein
MWFEIFSALTAIFITRKYINKTKWQALGWKALIVYNRCHAVCCDTFERWVGPYFVNNEPIIRIISNGNEIINYSLNDFMTKTNIPSQYDFILYEFAKDTNSKYICRYDQPSQLSAGDHGLDTTCHFLGIQYNIMGANNMGAIIAVDFGRHNYVVNGNILFDHKFNKWVLHNYCNYQLNDDEHYSVSFIDHYMNPVTITEGSFILINKNDYYIVNEHVEAAHVEAAHVEAAHVEAEHVEAAHVEAAHNDDLEKYVNENYIICK